MLTNSWIVVSKATSKAVLETWSAQVAAAINLDKYIVLTAHQYLVGLNKQIKQGAS